MGSSKKKGNAKQCQFHVYEETHKATSTSCIKDE